MMLGDRRFYFHEKCLEKYKELNPNTWLKQLEAATQRSY